MLLGKVMLRLQGCVDPFMSMCNGGGKSSPPPAPDYTSAAIAQSAGDQATARTTAKANRVSQYTPYGNLVYTNGINGDPDLWRADVTLSPDQSYLLNKQNLVSKGLADVSQTGLDYVKSALANPFDQQNLPMPVINPGTTAQQAIMARLQPTWDRKQANLENQLANQGITRGSEAWSNATKDLNEARNDAETQAALQGIGLDTQARQNAIQEQNFFRNEPLNMLNAVRTGAQVTNPTFVNSPQQAQTAGPNLMGAAQNTYNANLAAYNADQASNANMMNGLFSLGAAAIPLMSDRRLKRNIKRIGTHNLGIGIYSYEYVWGQPSVGVMADEVETVMPDAVMTHPSGYKMVNYALL